MQFAERSGQDPGDGDATHGRHPGQRDEAVIKHNLDGVLRFIIEYKSFHDGNSPSIREIMDACQITSTSVASNILRRLANRGDIRLVDDGESALSRNIEVVGGHWQLKIQ